MPHLLAQDLRNAVLQAAIQGKLTTQLSSDQPVSLLLESIKNEKDKLVKNKEIKKEKELLKIEEDEIPFDIPDNWSWVRMPDISLKITDGTHHSPINNSSGDYMYVTAKNIKNDGVDLKNITYVSEAVHKEIYSRCNPEYGDILYIKDGATTGVVTINDVNEPFSLLSSVALIKLGNNINNKYVMYAMRSPIFYGKTRDLMQGTGITRITLTVISSLVFPLPPVEEQARIVARVDELMTKIDEYEKIEKDLTELQKKFPGDMKDSILQAAMQGKLIGFDWNEDDNPEMYKPLWSVTAWDKKFKAVEKRKQSKVMDYHYYLAAEMRTIEDNTGDVFLLSTGDYQGWTTEEKTQGNFREGEIVSIPWGGSPNVKYFKGKFITSDNRIATALNTDELSNRFLYYYMLSKVEYLDTIYRGTGLRHPDMAAVLDMMIPLPPIEEQQRIVDKLDQLLPLCESLEAMI